MTVTNTLTFFNMFIDNVAHYAVPLFVFISGVALAYTYNKEFDAKKFFKKRAASVLPQYLIFSTFFLIFSYYMGSIFTASEIIFKFLTGSAFFHLWFFVLIIQLYIAFPALNRIHIHKATLLKALFIQVFFNIGILFINDTNTAIVAGSFFLTKIFYFMFGMYIGQHYNPFIRQLRNISLNKFKYTALILPLFITINWYLNTVAAGSFTLIPKTLFIIDQIIEPLFVLPIFFILFKAVNSTKLFVKELGRYSYGIYLVHAFYHIIITNWFISLGLTYNSWQLYPIVFTLNIFASYVTVLLLSNLPASKYIIGTKRTILPCSKEA